MFKYTAIIVEPRCHKALSFVLQNFFENLSDEWGFIIFHGTNNEEYVKNIINQQLPMHTYRIIKYVNLLVEDLNSLTYSSIFKSRLFYSHIETDLFLVFQTDSMIITENKELINNYLTYDYVGAPWADKVVGNGGLSLRNKHKMIEIINHRGHDDNTMEDYYFTRYHNIPMNTPVFEQAIKFSIETVFNDTIFGIHNAWKYLHSSQIYHLIHKYPKSNIVKLIELNQST
jgi:hypothetical protein